MTGNQKFFYIRRGVISLYMHYRAESEGVPRVNVLVDFTEHEWYKVLTRKVTPIIQLAERALVAAGMSMLWAPQNPRGFPIYGYQGKGIASGAMVVAALPEGRPLWVDQIRNIFLHPTSESMATYANIVLDEDDGDDIDVDFVPTREEVIILSSEGSDGSHEDLIHRFTRAGPQQRTVREPVAADVETLAEGPQGDTAEQLETRKKRKRDKAEEKKAEEPVTEAPRRRPSNSSFLDYVVVTNKLSGLGAGDKRIERDPDDDATLMEIMKKKKALEDKKKELDAHAAVALVEKKSKLQKDTATAPSESEIYLGVFSLKASNLLEKMYNSASGSRVPKSGKSTRKVDIYQITPPTSPPSRPFDLSPPHLDSRGKEKEDEFEQARNVAEDVAAGAEGGGAYVVGVATEVDSSEATPRQSTIYTKRIRTSGEGGASGVRPSPEFQHAQGGSWTTHNLSYDDLTNVPHWTLTQGSRMNDIANCREFYFLSLPPAERMFQKNHHWLDLLDDHIHASVNFYATCQEIVREWQLMGEDTLESETAKKELAEEREKLMRKRRGLKLKGEKTQTSNEQEEERALYQKRENEYIQRITKLEKIASEKVAENKASEILAEETTAACKWLLVRAVPLISEHIVKSDELAKYMFELV
ncbi:hypothetical protein Hanom_Chr11g00981031 [Helianthus anomalus]